MVSIKLQVGCLSRFFVALEANCFARDNWSVLFEQSRSRLF